MFTSPAALARRSGRTDIPARLAADSMSVRRVNFDIVILQSGRRDVVRKDRMTGTAMQLRLICTPSRTRERLADCTFGAVARFTAGLARSPYIYPRRATTIR